MSIQTQLPNLYTAGIFVENAKIFVVRHANSRNSDPDAELVSKILGGTFMGDKENWEKRGEGAGYYNIFSKKEVEEKFRQVFTRVFRRDSKRELSQGPSRDEIIAFLLKRFKQPEEIHLVVESIEETGVIPMETELVHIIQISGHTKYFFKILTGFTFNRDRNQFIEIKNFERDLPQEGHDFDCVDPDIRGYEIINIAKLMSYRNVADDHFKALKKI